MSFRHLTRRVTTSVVATAAAGVAVLAFTAPAGATGPASGDIVPNAAVPQAPYTAGQPFDSGQTITVQVPATSIFDANHHINIVECAAPNGVPPSTPTNNCDGNTIQGDSIIPNADGSFSYGSYTVYALPDQISLGENPNAVPKCGNTAATECILFIGEDQNDFTQPHVWSQPFKINANADDSGSNPGDGTPEIQMAVILPIAAMGLLGGAVLFRRRRAARSA